MNIAALKYDTESLQNADVEELKKITEMYPYFSTAQFFLTKKMKHENNTEFLKELQKSAVYFFNPFWLHYQLLHEIDFRKETKIEDEEQRVHVFTLLEEEAIIQNKTDAPKNEKEQVKNLDVEDETALKEDINKVLEENSNDADIETEIPSKLTDVLQAQFDEFKKPVEKNTELPIEIKSYHTVDYFASQGIKVDAQFQDKLGKQVLRFTDWLKHMKRINPQPGDLGTEKELENNVISNAAHSIEPKEVLTEAMAEVLEKQGKTKQAIELYEKLSLLHPDKSVYFAARIENIKR